MTGHTDTFAERGVRDPRPMCKPTPTEIADAWKRAALNEAVFGDPAKADKYRLYAGLAAQS